MEHAHASGASRWQAVAWAVALAGAALGAPGLQAAEEVAEVAGVAQRAPGVGLAEAQRAAMAAAKAAGTDRVGQAASAAAKSSTAAAVKIGAAATPAPRKTIVMRTDAPDLILPDGGRYYGPVVNGLAEGEGRIEWSANRWYAGQLHQGRMHGQGRLDSAGGYVEGEFRGGMPNGQGTQQSVTGTRYTGQFKDGNFEGQGEVNDPKGTCFVGQFQGGTFTGQGSKHFPDGQVMTGQFVDYQPRGVMLTRHPSGAQLSSEMDGDRPVGMGEVRLPNGMRIRGDMGSGLDEGEIDHPNGDRYKGELFMQVAHGEGELRHANGDVYRGEFARGLPEGAGVLTPAHGGKAAVKTGHWRRGRYMGKAVAEAIASGPAQAARNNQDALYLQNQLLGTQIGALKVGNPKAREMYALFVAGDGTQEVFRREVEWIADAFAQRYDTAGRAVVLANSRTSVQRLPLATETSIERALSALAQRMDKDHDLLFVYLTSHGSRDHQLQIDMRGMALPQLPAKRLGELLKASGIRHQVVVVSACYAGGFIEPLASPTTWVIAAARADRSSFGCADENDFTYFGRALFKESLPQAASLTGAFEQAKRLVAQWERELGADDGPDGPPAEPASSSAATHTAASGQAGDAGRDAARGDAQAAQARPRTSAKENLAHSEPQMRVSPAFQREVDAWFAQHAKRAVNAARQP